MTEKKEKPLSEKKRGYLLAILGGTLAIPFGWLTSPLVLYCLNKKLKEKDGKQPNRFKIWALLGIVGAPLSLSLVFLIPSDVGNIDNTAQKDLINESKEVFKSEKVLKKELLAEGIDFIATGKCFNFEDDPNKKILFGSAFGNYVIDKADSPLGEFPRDPVPFQSKAWNKCYGRSKVIDTYQLGDGRMYKSKTYFYKSIKAQVKVNTNRNYIESFIFDFSSN